MAYVCTKPPRSCAGCRHYKYDVNYGEKVCYAQIEKTLENIVPGQDAVFLPGKIHGCEWQVYIIYLNESANEGNGSFEIEILDAERIINLYEEVSGDAERFFELLPDKFQGEWQYCNNTPETKEVFDDYVDTYFDADFICGEDGGKEEELKFLVEWAKKARTLQ